MFQKHFMSLHAISKGQGTMALCVKKPVKRFRWDEQSVTTAASPSTSTSLSNESSIPELAAMPEFILSYYDYIEHPNVQFRIFGFVYGSKLRTESERFRKWIHLWKRLRRFDRCNQRRGASSKPETPQALIGLLTEITPVFPSIEPEEPVELNYVDKKCNNICFKYNGNICINSKYAAKLLRCQRSIIRLSIKQFDFSGLPSKRPPRYRPTSSRWKAITKVPTNLSKTYEVAESATTRRITVFSQKSKRSVRYTRFPMYFIETILNLQRRATCDLLSVIFLAKIERCNRAETFASLHHRSTLYLCLLQSLALVSGSRNR